MDFQIKEPELSVYHTLSSRSWASWTSWASAFRGSWPCWSMQKKRNHYWSVLFNLFLLLKNDGLWFLQKLSYRWCFYQFTWSHAIYSIWKPQLPNCASWSWSSVSSRACGSCHRCFRWHTSSFCLRPENRPSVLAFFLCVLVLWGGGGWVAGVKTFNAIAASARTSCYVASVVYLHIYFVTCTSSLVFFCTSVDTGHTSFYGRHVFCTSVNTLRVTLDTSSVLR